MVECLYRTWQPGPSELALGTLTLGLLARVAPELSALSTQPELEDAVFRVSRQLMCRASASQAAVVARAEQTNEPVLVLGWGPDPALFRIQGSRA